MHAIVLRVVSAGLTLLAATVLISGVALADKPLPPLVNKPLQLGNDISWPQCNKKLPAVGTFGIVGVNGGTANTTNPCFAAEFAWANTAMGGTGQPKVALYANTGNPGLQGSWWPASNFYGGEVVANPYGICTGNVDAACAYMYGYAKAYDDTGMRGVINPSGYLWWLDVETSNTWQTDKTANTADLEGMVAYFQSINAPVGLYSTGYQWGQIAGTTAATSPLYNSRDWLAGASSQASSITKCAAAPLTGNGQVVLTQFVSKNLDNDYSCI